MVGDSQYLQLRRAVRLVVAASLCNLCSACGSQTDISFFVLVKSSNYAQDTAGTLTLLNYHFFSEIFLREGGGIERASLSFPNRPLEPMAYEDRGANYYVEGGHFDSLEELDTAYPNGTFLFDIEASSVSLVRQALQLAGPGGKTELPAPITISLAQSGRAAFPMEIDAHADLIIRWSEYAGGAPDPRGIVDDMIFVVVADCQGERVVHTGLPFQGSYLTYRARQVTVAANTLAPGQPYSMFVEFPRVIDSREIRGVPGFTSYATATYLDLHTKGQSTDGACLDVLPPMDTGQTDRMGSPASDSADLLPHREPTR